MTLRAENSQAVNGQVANIRAVFFDIGETILERSAEYAAWARLCGVSSHTFSAVFGAIVSVGGGVADVVEHFWPGSSPAAVREQLQAAGLDARVAEADVYPGVRQALARLRAAGLFVGIVGNQPVAVGDQVRALELPADLVAASAQWTIAKPAPEFFARCVSLAGCAPDQAVYVGDQLVNDVAAPLAAGLHSIRVRTGPWGQLTHDADLEARCVAVVDSAAAVPDVLGCP